MRQESAHPSPHPRKRAHAKAVAAGMLVLLGLAPLWVAAAPSAGSSGQVPGRAGENSLPGDFDPPGPPPGVSLSLPASAMPGRAGRLVEFQGAVWLFDLAQGRWEEGLRNRALTSGDRVSTGADGRAEVRIGSTELRLGPRTELEFVEVAEDRLVWRLASGSLAWRVRRHEIARESEVRAAGVRVRAEGPGHFRLDVDDALVWASAWRGSLRVDSGDQLVQVGAGRRAEFMRPGPGPGTAVTWSAPVRDAFSDWVARDEVRDDQQTASAAYVSPEMTGVEDLDRHGRWERHPEFGVVWTPLVVSAGWEPFRHGRWVWHVRWGWTWVDAAPWGFAPFHYGRWVSWGGRWCWVPGPYMARPAFSPALVAWFGSPGPGVSVGVTLHGRHWAPLPPRYVPGPPRGEFHDPRRRVPEPQGRAPLPDPHWRAPAPDGHAYPVRPPRSAPPAEPRQSAQPAHPMPGSHSLPPAESAQPVQRVQPAPVSPLPAAREPAQAAMPARPSPSEAADRPRRSAPGERSPRVGAADEGERPRGGERASREERQDSASASPAPTRVRVPEAMRDRPKDRQQTM